MAALSMGLLTVLVPGNKKTRLSEQENMSMINKFVEIFLTRGFQENTNCGGRVDLPSCEKLDQEKLNYQYMVFCSLKQKLYP